MNGIPHPSSPHSSRSGPCRRVLLIAVLALGLAVAWITTTSLAGCGGGEEATTSTSLAGTTSSVEATTSSPVAEGACSASNLDLELAEQAELPPAIAATREQMFAGAMSCDFDGLENLAQADDFTFSFGAPEGGPAAYWRAAEKRGDPVMATLAQILNMPFGRMEDLYVWPYAYAVDFAELSAEQEEQLRQYFTDQEIADWKSFGGYSGYRVGIAPSGDWLFYVAGD
jgi:hypothetical protein